MKQEDFFFVSALAALWQLLCEGKVGAYGKFV